jgi:hypothetical protein
MDRLLVLCGPLQRKCIQLLEQERQRLLTEDVEVPQENAPLSPICLFLLAACGGPSLVSCWRPTREHAPDTTLSLPACSLPWTVSGVMLACAKDYYHCQQERLLYEFRASHVSTGDEAPNLRLEWIDRERPRK